MPSPAGIGVDDAGIGPGEVVIPGKQPVPSAEAAVKEEQEMALSLMVMGIRFLVIFPVIKSISSLSVEAPPRDRYSSK